jgi:hypothetical protein
MQLHVDVLEADTEDVPAMKRPQRCQRWAGFTSEADAL